MGSIKKKKYSITALHYLNAGLEGRQHFNLLLNGILSDINNASLDELNTVHGKILYKNHSLPRSSDRSYRNISTCPFLSKCIDLYIKDLYGDNWNEAQALTQYQGKNSSHELASLLVTETIEYSLSVSNKPVFFLCLDAKSAFDKCLKEILVSCLFKSKVEGDALLLINNRLSNRKTVYEWDRKLMGPAVDETGTEQGAI